MTFTLRSTTPSDIPTLHRLMRDFATYEKLEHRFKITEADLHDVTVRAKPAARLHPGRSRRRHGRFRALVFPFGTFSGRYGLFVEDIYVEPAHRGRGIGLRPVPPHGAHRLARECVDMEWNVLDWNTPAIEFYRRIGAKPVRGWIPQQLSGDALIALAEGAENG